MRLDLHANALKKKKKNIIKIIEDYQSDVIVSQKLVMQLLFYTNYKTYYNQDLVIYHIVSDKI